MGIPSLCFIWIFRLVGRSGAIFVLILGGFDLFFVFFYPSTLTWTKKKKRNQDKTLGGGGSVVGRKSRPSTRGNSLSMSLAYSSSFNFIFWLAGHPSFCPFLALAHFHTKGWNPPSGTYRTVVLLRSDRRKWKEKERPPRKTSLVSRRKDGKHPPS